MSDTAGPMKRSGLNRFGAVSAQVKIPRLYARRFIWGIVLQLTTTLLFVEAILLAEKLNDVLRAALDDRRISPISSYCCCYGTGGL